MRCAFLAAALLMAGCAQPVDIQSRADAAFAHYRGHHVSDLSVVWGPPEQAITRPEGTIYTYASQANALMATGPYTTAPVTVSCRVSVYTDWSSNIIGWKSNGALQGCREMFDRLH